MEPLNNLVESALHLGAAVTDRAIQFTMVYSFAYAMHITLQLSEHLVHRPLGVMADMIPGVGKGLFKALHPEIQHVIEEDIKRGTRLDQAGQCACTVFAKAEFEKPCAGCRFYADPVLQHDFNKIVE